MDYVNEYVPPTEQPIGGWIIETLPESELYGPTPYDINFAYPLHVETLQNDRVKLVPYVPRVHAETFWQQTKDQARELSLYYPVAFFTLADSLTIIETHFRRKPHCIVFAVIDKTRPDVAHPEWGGSLAGVIGMLDTAPNNLTTEIGYVFVFPAFQHTHVAKDMVGILMRYMLQPPSASPPGLGFRRVNWTAHPDNASSVGLAQRMCMKKEGVKRWQWILPDALREMGLKPRETDPFPDKNGRHTVMLALCWDDWEAGAREEVERTIGGKKTS